VAVAIAVVPAVAMAMADPRPADHGAGGATDHRADRAGDDRARGSTDRRAGYRSFGAVGRVCDRGQGDQRRAADGSQKFVHRILRNSICGKRANTRKVHRGKKLFSLTGRNMHRSNCGFENPFTFANKPNLYGVI
jgi:hypothetical protein